MHTNANTIQGKKIMKNTIVRSAFITIAALASAASFAAPTVELKVTGVITPPACQPGFSDAGVVDYGVIPAASLKVGENKSLDVRQVTLNVTCDSAAKIALKFSDNRASSRVAGLVSLDYKPEDFNYGLGAVAGQNVGGYYLALEAGTTADGVVVKNMWSNDGKKWLDTVKNLQHVNHRYTFGDSNLQPVAFRQLSLKINVHTVLNKPENLPLTQEVPLDGSATGELVYL